jgi:hypothetical protein
MTMTTIAPVTKSVTVHATPEKAFEVFTARFADWWPLATHHTADAEAATAVIEPHAGGRWFETGVDGRETMWGYVTAWEPPGRLVLAWHLNPSFQFDPDVASEVEVTFVANDAATTTVTLEHRGFEVYGDGGQPMRDAVGNETGGWGGIMEEFAELVG